MGSTQAIYMLTIFWGRFRTPRGGPVKQYLQGKPEKNSYAPAARPRHVEKVPLIEFSEKSHVALCTGGNTTFSCFCHVKSGLKVWTIVLSSAEFVKLFTINFHAIYFISMLTFDILKNRQTKLSLLSELLFGLRSSSSIPPKVMPVTHESPCKNALRQGFPNLMSLLPLPFFR